MLFIGNPTGRSITLLIWTLDRHREGRHHFFHADHGAAANRPAHYGSWPVIVLERKNRGGGGVRLAVRFCNPQLGTALVVLGMLTAGNTLQSEPWEEKVQMHSSKIGAG